MLDVRSKECVRGTAACCCGWFPCWWE